MNAVIDLPTFNKTAKQVEACNLMNHHEHTLLKGGSRSGKTFIAVRNIVLRATKFPSNHLIARYRFNHVKQSIWHKTMPDVLKTCFSGMPVGEDKSSWFWTIPTQCGNTSKIWIGGLDDKDRVEKVLGNEYSTILLNEISQISHDAASMVRSRLAENVGLKLRMYYDLNPVGKKHWAYQEFTKGVIPNTHDKCMLDMVQMVMNPKDNLANLTQQYIKILEALPKRQRQRFLEGLDLDDVDGALWTDAMVSEARNRPYGKITKIVVSVDPSVSHNKNSDECGIVVTALDENKDGVVLGDFSGKMSTATWAQRVVNVYDKFSANEVVVESNQGGDLVIDVLKALNNSLKIVKVFSKNGKFTRAEPVSGLYETNEYTKCRVSHAETMPDLESEMTEWVPMDSKQSPNRIDALVQGLTYLMIKPKHGVNIG